MWPDEDDDEGWEDEPEDDEAAITARVRAAYRSERARIRDATDVDALLELQAECEAELEVGALTGVAEACARDLVARIVARVGDLEAARRARIERVRREERERSERQARREAQAREESARRQREAAERQAQERARRVAEAERVAAARLAHARAAEVEARAALLQAKAAQAGRGAATGARRPAARAESGASRRPVSAAPRASEAPETTPIEEADRAALMAAGRWPPPEPRPHSPFWSPEDRWPKTWTLTGFDLAELRGRLRVTQRVFAGQLGVETVEVARAEAQPRDKVRPALQVALRRVLDEQMRRRAAAGGGGRGRRGTEGGAAHRRRPRGLPRRERADAAAGGGAARGRARDGGEGGAGGGQGARGAARSGAAAGRAGVGRWKRFRWRQGSASLLPEGSGGEWRRRGALLPATETRMGSRSPPSTARRGVWSDRLHRRRGRRGTPWAHPRQSGSPPSGC